MPEQKNAAAEQAPPAAPGVPEQARGSLLRRLNPVNYFRRESPGRYVREGQALMDAKNYAQATIAFNKAIALDPHCADAYAGLGSVLVRKGGRMNMEQALKHFGEALQRDPFAEEVYGISARVYDHLNRPKEATLERKKLVIVKTLAAEPDNPVANNNMGILMLKQRRVDEALEHFNRALRSNPRYDVALRNVATAYYQLARDTDDEAQRRPLLDKAQGHITKALEVMETVPSLLALARILILQKDYEEALGACLRAQELDPAHKDVYGLKKVVLERLSRMEEAREAFAAYQTFSGRGGNGEGGGEASS